MQVMPILRLGLANLWVLLVIYLLIFSYFVFRLPKEKREWLFADPKQMIHGVKKLILRSGQILTFVFIVLVGLAPLNTQPLGLALLGLSLYVTGTVLVLVSLYFFGLGPNDQPVLDGPYRFSRNP